MFGLERGRVALTAHDGTWEAEAARTAELSFYENYSERQPRT